MANCTAIRISPAIECKCCINDTLPGLTITIEKRSDILENRNMKNVLAFDWKLVIFGRMLVGFDCILSCCVLLAVIVSSAFLSVVSQVGLLQAVQLAAITPAYEIHCLG